MGRRNPFWKFLNGTTTPGVGVLIVLGVLLTLSSRSDAGASVSSSGTSYSKNFYQPQVHYQQLQPTTVNTSGAVFEPRDGGGSSFGSSGGGYSGGGGGGGGGGYSGGGGYDMGGGYGAPAAMSPAVYKYQIYPSPPMMSSMGWGSDDDDDDGGGDFPKELLGLLGLKGLKGLKPLKLLKLLLLLKKLLGIPLFPLFLPLLLPLLLLKLAVLLIPLALILLIPVPVISTGRKLLESPAGQNFKKFLQEKLDRAMANLPEDISHIVEKIKEKSADMQLSQLLTSSPAEEIGSARGPASSWGSNGKIKNIYGETGSRRTKVVYAASVNSANIKPSVKSIKFAKVDKSQTTVKKVTT